MPLDHLVLEVFEENAETQIRSCPPRKQTGSHCVWYAKATTELSLPDRDPVADFGQGPGPGAMQRLDTFVGLRILALSGLVGMGFVR